MAARLRYASTSFVLACFVAATLTPTAHAEPGDVVEFGSAQLEWCVRAELDLGSAEPVTLAAIESLTSLDCLAVEGSVAGLESATNLESLRLALADVSDWDTLSTLTRLTSLNVEESNITSLAWLSGATALSTVTLDSTAVSDLSPLASKPLTQLSVRDLALDTIDFLEGHATLAELHFDENNVDDISALATLPSLTTVTFDWNRVVDVTPLAELNLTTWSAQNERGTLAPIEACVQHSMTGGHDIDGTTYPLLALDVPNDVESFVAPFNGTLTLVTRSGESNFSARFEVESYGHVTPCAWPEEYLPKLSFPTKLTVGQMASISIDEWGTRVVEPAYEWTYDTGGVAGITRSVIPTSDGVGRTVTPRAITRADGMETVTATGPALVIKYGLPTDARLSFATPPTVGQAPEIVSDQDWSPVTLKCTWLLDGLAVVTDKNCAWVVPSTAAGKQLSAHITVQRANHHDAAYSIAASTVLRAFAKSTAGYIVGNGDVGSTLKLAPLSSSEWSPVPASRTYQWLRNGVVIAGATGSTYTLQSADAGKAISVEVTGHKTGYRSVTIETPPVTVKRIFTTKPTPTIAGTKSVGSTLTASKGTWSPAASAYKFQWYRNGKAIAGATKSSYKTTTTDGGQKITLRVTATRSGYTTASMTSTAVTILKKFSKTPTPTIVGTKRVKSTLTAKPGAWSPSATVSYQWYRNGKAISGATKSTYKPGVNDAYASFSVKVTAKKSGYASVSKTSKAVTASGIKYTNCAALRKDYPGGVAKASATKNKVSGVAREGIRSTTFVSAKLYALNAARDSDKDGWACE